MEQHIIFMNQALEQACIAAKKNEVPIGAVVVSKEGIVIGRGHNQVMQKKSQHAHAEVLALEEAGKSNDDWRMNGCTLYVTLEPCKMCYSLVQLSRCEALVFGASSPLFGFQLDNQDVHSVYKNNTLTIIKDVGMEKSITLLQSFFLERRKKDEQ